MNVEYGSYSLKNLVRNPLANILGVIRPSSGTCFVPVPSHTEVKFLWVQHAGPSLMATQGRDTQIVTIHSVGTVKTGERDQDETSYYEAETYCGLQF
jgi:hypothetical protein